MSRTVISAEIRRRVAETSRHRCGYCLTSQRIIGPLLEIDHIVPESRGGTSEEKNLILACKMCNSHKASREEALDPETGSLQRLFHPREDRWHEHFEWVDGGAVIQGKTPLGRATVIALQMNHPDILMARKLWVLAGWYPPVD